MQPKISVAIVAIIAQILILLVNITHEADNRVYALEDYVDMLEVYILSHRRPTAAAADYAIRYPNRRHPSGRTFQRNYDRLKETGSVMPDIHHHHHAVEHLLEDNFDAEDEILRILTEEPGIGMREVANRIGESYSMVQRFLKFIGMFLIK